MVRPSSRPEPNKFAWVGHDDVTNEFDIGVAGETITVRGDLVVDGTSTVTGAASSGAQTFTADVTLADTVDIIVNATTGSVIATAVTQKLAFWGATPVVQPADAAQVAPAAYVTGAFGLDSDVKMQALFDLVVEMRTALVATGIMKGAA